ERHFLGGDRRDLLRYAIVPQLEVRGGEPRDRLIAAMHRHHDRNAIDAGLEHLLRVDRRCSCERRQRNRGACQFPTTQFPTPNWLPTSNFQEPENPRSVEPQNPVSSAPTRSM